MASLEDIPPDVRDQLALLARELVEDPKTRKQFLRLTKEKRPNVPIPEIEIEDSTNTALNAALKKVQTLEDKLAERAALDNLDDRRRKLIDEGKARDMKDVTEIEKIMVEKKIADHESAADYWHWMNEAAKPSAPVFHTGVMDKTTRDTLGKFMKNPTQAARDEAQAAIIDFRRAASGRAA